MLQPYRRSSRRTSPPRRRPLPALEAEIVALLVSLPMVVVGALRQSFGFFESLAVVVILLVTRELLVVVRDEVRARGKAPPSVLFGGGSIPPLRRALPMSGAPDTR